MRAALVPLVLASALAPSPAHACGGCFAPPTDNVSTVTDHRMVLALSDTQSTLWDQIRYSGNPSDFVWVLPTPGPANVQLASEDFFDALDTRTTPRIYAPPMGGGGGGFTLGCGAEASATGGGSEDVTVYHQGTVGPYDTATIGSTDPNALEAWLLDHGYAVPDAIKPTIAWYVQKGWAFNALRLRPGASTDQMQPVRVTFNGLSDVLPLRMVAAGAGDELGLLLWVIADQRYQTVEFDTTTIDDSQLVWSTASNRSNYRELFAAAVGSSARGAWVVEFAGQLSAWDIPMTANDDLKVAEQGQPGPLFLTRLRTSLRPSQLATDLTLVPAPDSTPVSNYHYLASNQVQSAPLAAALGGSRGPMMAGLLAACLLALALRRRR